MGELFDYLTGQPLPLCHPSAQVPINGMMPFLCLWVIDSARRWRRVIATHDVFAMFQGGSGLPAHIASFRNMIAISLALLAFAVPALGQTCTTSTCTAAGTSQAQVLAALPSNANANATVVVNIPSGTSAWTTGIAYTIPSAVTNLTIQGNSTVNCTGTAGTSSYACTATDNTVFVDSYDAANGALFNVNVGSSAFRMTGLTFLGGTISPSSHKPNGFLNFSGSSSSFRIDHSHFDTYTYNQFGAGGGMTIFTNIYGVVDHNLFELSGENNGIRDYSGSGDFGDANWAQPSNLGTANYVYAENNEFKGGASNDCDDGGRMVERYNTIVADPTEPDTGLWQGHQMGQGTQRSRGCRSLEIYHNYILNPNPSGNPLYTPGGGGVGVGIVWNNTISSGYSYDLDFWNARELATSHVQTAPPNGIGYCGNGSSGVTSAWDGNTISATGYPCINQLGRGQGDLLNGVDFPNAGISGCTPGSTCVAFWPHNKREPWYIWNEIIASGNVITNPAWNGVAMQPDRDFYAPNASFTGTSGTGWGVLASRPSTCTAGPGGTYDTSPTGSYGVGYFATDTNTLYVCTATNTWTAIYQPYPWPHPLIGGSVSLTVTATNGSVSGPNCASGSYASGTSIGACSVTPDSGFTFTGWSGTGSCSGVSGSGTASCTLTTTSTLTASFASIASPAPPTNLSGTVF